MFKNETSDSLEICIPVTVSASLRFWMAEGDELTAELINERLNEFAFAAESDVIRLPSFDTGDMCMNVIGVEPGAKADAYNSDFQGQLPMPEGVDLAPEDTTLDDTVAALRLALERLEMNNYDHEEDEFIAEINAAISKAEWIPA